MANNYIGEVNQISNSDLLFKPFRKTDELVPGVYKVSYLRKIKGKFGTRVRCYCADFNYDLSTGFTQQLNGYDLDDLDYSNVEMQYVGRRHDSYRTISMHLRGLPPLQRPPVQSPTTTGAIYNSIIRSQNFIQSSNITTTTANNNNVLANPTINVCTIASTPNTATPTTTTTTTMVAAVSSSSSTSSPSSSSSSTVKPPVVRALRFDEITPLVGKRTLTSSIIVNDDDDDEIPLPKVCKICLHNPHNAVLLTFEHVDICFPCGEKFVKNPCPFCRRKVTKVIKTFGGE